MTKLTIKLTNQIPAEIPVTIQGHEPNSFNVISLITETSFNFYIIVSAYVALESRSRIPETRSFTDYVDSRGFGQLQIYTVRCCETAKACETCRMRRG